MDSRFSVDGLKKSPLAEERVEEDLIKQIHDGMQSQQEDSYKKSMGLRGSQCALMNWHNTHPRANKQSDPSPKPLEDMIDRHSTWPRANVQSEPSPMPKEEIYTQIRVASPDALKSRSHRSPRSGGRNGRNPNPRSSTPSAASTVTCCSVESMVTSPVSNNTSNVNEKCSSRKFKALSSSAKESEEYVAEELGSRVVTPASDRRMGLSQQPYNGVNPSYYVQNSCGTPTPSSTSATTSIVCILNPQGGPPQYYGLPAGASMMLSNSYQPSLYPQPPVPCPIQVPQSCSMQVPQAPVNSLYATTANSGAHQQYYQPLMYGASQVQYQFPQYYDQQQYQSAAMNPSFAMMRNHLPVNVNLPLTTENVNMHNLSHMS